MKTIEFEQVNIRIAEEQPEFETVPAHVQRDGTVIACIEFSPFELQRINQTKKFWYQILAAGQNIQPFMMQVENPFKTENLFAQVRISNERIRQKTVKGYSEKDDDIYVANELFSAAECYVDNDYSFWPWDVSTFKQTTRERDLEKAGALVQAEIDRLERYKLKICDELNDLITINKS